MSVSAYATAEQARIREEILRELDALDTLSRRFMWDSIPAGTQEAIKAHAQRIISLIEAVN